MTPLEPLVLIPGAFVAGLLMFLAPCTLPIVPGYLLYIAGVPQEGAAQGKRRIVSNAVAFVLGFSLVFILLGLFAGTLGAFLNPYRDALMRVTGALFIIFGLILTGVITSVVGKEWHMKMPTFLTLGSWQSSSLIGALFAIGWSPCIGPILGSVLLVASQSATAPQGAVLLAVFSLGLGVPFILTALMLERVSAYIERWSKYTPYMNRIVGVLLIVVGALILFGMLSVLMDGGYQLFDWLGYNTLYRYL
jgi:cytochrome c-type biogenesis protein